MCLRVSMLTGAHALHAGDTSTQLCPMRCSHGIALHAGRRAGAARSMSDGAGYQVPQVGQQPGPSAMDSPNAKYGRRSQPASPPSGAYAPTGATFMGNTPVASPMRAASPNSAGRVASLQQLKQARSAGGIPPPASAPGEKGGGPVQ